ncbi:MAG TPA: hypothetical protein VK149_13410, partial [Sideroxyarcus sp.]|nr:hypothetical protein [Sideroxyarcus sp.]
AFGNALGESLAASSRASENRRLQFEAQVGASQDMEDFEGGQAMRAMAESQRREEAQNFTPQEREQILALFKDGPGRREPTVDELVLKMREQAATLTASNGGGRGNDVARVALNIASRFEEAKGSAPAQGMAPSMEAYPGADGSARLTLTMGSPVALPPSAPAPDYAIESSLLARGSQTTGNDYADRLIGGVQGVVATGLDAVNGTVRILGNTVLQIGDILTGGVNHDSPLMQQVWIEQGALANGVANLVTSPRVVTGQVIQGIADNYARAEALRARGDEIGAARINSRQTAGIAATVLGGAQAIRATARFGATGLQGMGVPDWNIRVAPYRPGTLSMNPTGLELDRVGGTPLPSGVRAYPDGSLRTPDGKFSSIAGQPAPGTVNAANYAEFLRSNGVNVVGTELEVVGPLGVRKYDIGTRNPDGSIFGIEIKSGEATLGSYQEFSDMYINQFGAIGRGRIAGQPVTGSMTIYLPPGG